MDRSTSFHPEAGYTASMNSAARRLRPELEPLAKQLAALPAEDRRAVVEAAEAGERSPLPTIPWKELEEAFGIVSFGGDAVEDCRRLYDG
jgi:hypothetical protein